MYRTTGKVLVWLVLLNATSFIQLTTNRILSTTLHTGIHIESLVTGHMLLIKSLFFAYRACLVALGNKLNEYWYDLLPMCKIEVWWIGLVLGLRKRN